MIRNMFRMTLIIIMLKKLVYALALVCFVLLSVTGFGPWLIPGDKLSGYWMMAHVTFAPVFALCIAALAVMYGYNQRFDKIDWLFVSRIFRRRTPDEESVGNGSILIMKVCFWLICVLTIPLILSIVLSMFPLFGTAGEKFLLQLHRYSGLLLAPAAILHTYLVIRTQAQKGQQSNP